MRSALLAGTNSNEAPKEVKRSVVGFHKGSSAELTGKLSRDPELRSTARLDGGSSDAILCQRSGPIVAQTVPRTVPGAIDDPPSGPLQTRVITGDSSPSVVGRCQLRRCFASRRSPVRFRLAPPRKALQIGRSGNDPKCAARPGSKQGKSKWIGPDCQRAVARALARAASPATIGGGTPLSRPRQTSLASAMRVFGMATQRRSVTPEVAGSSPVAPVSHSESDCARSRAFARRSNGGAPHHEPSKVSSRHKNGEQNGDHGRGAMAGDRP